MPPLFYRKNQFPNFLCLKTKEYDKSTLRLRKVCSMQGFDYIFQEPNNE